MKNSSIEIKKYFLIFNKFDKLIILIFSIMFVFGTIDVYLIDEKAYLFYEIFNRGIGVKQFFSLFDVFFIIVTFVILFKVDLKGNDATKFEIFLLFYSLLCWFLNMINPNSDPDNPILGMPLFSNVSEYLFIWLLVVFGFISSTKFLSFIFLFTKYVAFIILIKTLYLLLFWAIGEGQNEFFGFNATVTESDTLFLFSLFQSLSLMLFLLYKKSKYALLWLLLTFTIVFSYRRATLMIAISVNIISYFFYVLFSTDIKRKLSTLLFLVLGVILLYNVESLHLNASTERLLLRYVAVLPGMEAEKTGEFSDSGHWDQTLITFYSFFNKDISFFGQGYGNLTDETVEGQTLTIHNLYVSSWAYFGLHEFILILIIVISVIVLFIKTLIRLFVTKNAEENKLLLIKITIISYLIMYFVVMAFTSYLYFYNFKMQLIWVLLLLFVMKVDFNSWLFFKVSSYRLKS